MKINQKVKDGLNYVVGIILVVLVCSLLLYSATADASDKCKDWATAAERAMQARQEHIDINIPKENLAKSNLSQENKNTLTYILNLAYVTPIDNRIQAKLELIEAFGDHIFLECIQQTGKEG